MKDYGTRRFEMFIGVHEFGAAHAESFPADSRGGELFADLNSIITEMQNHAASQDSGKRATKEGTTLVAIARAELREELDAIYHTARSMAHAIPGVADKFHLPNHARDQELLTTARAFAADAAPLKAEFVRRGMPATFLEDLAGLIATFEQSIGGREQRTGARVAATAAIDGAIERGINAVRELDAIVRNIFRNDAGVLAEWTSASHTERAARGATTDTPPTPPAPAQS
jgi:hypothetical protein